MAGDRTDVHELPTPRSISRTGYRVHVWCKACRRAKDADLAALVDARKGDVPLVRPRWRCGNCGSRLTEFVVGGSHIRAMNASAFAASSGETSRPLSVSRRRRRRSRLLAVLARDCVGLLAALYDLPFVNMRPA